MGPWEYCEPLLRHREPFGFSRDERRWPMIFSALLTTFWSAFLSAAGTSHTRTQCSDALYRALTQALGAQGECPLAFWESPVSEQQLEPATDWRSWQRPLAAKPCAPSVPWPLGWWPSTSASPRAPPPWGWGCWCDSTSKWAKKLFCQHQRRGTIVLVSDVLTSLTAVWSCCSKSNLYTSPPSFDWPRCTRCIPPVYPAKPFCCAI